MKVSLFNVKDLKPAKYNPRKDLKPGDKEYEKIKNSINVFGYVEPIIINSDNTIIGGHQRLKVLKDLGYTEVECVQVDIDKDQEKALNIALNKISGEWDFEALESLLHELRDADFDIELTGFDLDEISGILEGEENEPQDDEFDVDAEIENIQEPITKTGDLWKLGNHRLLCGDSTKPEDVERLMGGKEADLVITDPPYNVVYVGKTSDKLTIQNDNMENSQFRMFLVDAFKNMKNAMKKGGVFYIWHADSEGYNFRGACFDNDLKIRQCLIWNKNSMVLGRQDYHWKHEPCLYGWKDGAGHYFIDDRTLTTVIDDKIDVNKLKKDEMKALIKELLNDKLPTTVINEDRPFRSKEHPTMKPIKLIAYLIKNSSRRGELVLDLFGGSGSTLIASDQLDRINCTMEFDPKYCDVIVARWEKYTGQKAVLENNE